MSRTSRRTQSILAGPGLSLAALLFASVLALVSAGSARAADDEKEAAKPPPSPAARTGQKVENGPTIEFDDQTFRLVYKDDVDGMLLNEYVPEGESLDGWRQMLSVRFFEGQTDHEKAANGLLGAIAKQNPSARYAIWQSKDGSLTGVDFVITDGKGIAEFNVFLYELHELGSGKKGVRAQQYAMRVYGNRIGPFLQSLVDGNREYLIEKVVRYRFPEIVH